MVLIFEKKIVICDEKEAVKLKKIRIVSREKLLTIVLLIVTVNVYPVRGVNTAVHRIPYANPCTKHGGL